MKIVYRQPNWDPLINLLSRKEYAGLDVLDYVVSVIMLCICKNEP